MAVRPASEDAQNEPEPKRARVEKEFAEVNVTQEKELDQNAANDDAAISSSSSSEAIIVSSRKSALALYQTHYVINRLKNVDPKLKFEILKGSTFGDDVQNRHLADLGKDATGLFTKELELQLLHGQTKFAVHSLKDMPTRLPEGLVLAAVSERADERDCVVIHPRFREKGVKSFEDLIKLKSKEKEGSKLVVGSSSIRREALLKHKLGDAVDIKVIRGNVQTRIAKSEAESNEYDCIILAKIGLERVELGHKIEFILEPEDFPYAVGQGAFGVECRASDQETIDLLKKGVECNQSTFRCLAERSLLSALEGGCQVSMGIRSTITSATDSKFTLSLYAKVLKRDGTDYVEAGLSKTVSTSEDAMALGKELASKLVLLNVSRIVGYEIGKEKRPITYGSMETAGIPTEGF